MAEEAVYKYRHYDILNDDYVYSTRYATMTKINRIGAEPVYEHRAIIDTKYLVDGWTEKNFSPRVNSPKPAN